MELEALKGWENFYVITGSAAAGLTGITFVVIALVRDAPRINPAGLGTFMSPTIVHFTAVLMLAAFLCVPRLTAPALTAGLSLLGGAGLLYVASIAHRIVHRVSDYSLVLEDWAFNVALPALAYGLLLVMGLTLARRAQTALEGIAAACLFLLVIGIHNAWDIAVWISLRQGSEPTRSAAPVSGKRPSA